MLTIFCGYDDREAVGTHVFMSSVLKRSSVPVSFVPLKMQNIKQGTNQFTLSRFLVPYLMGFRGEAIFADAADMICLADVAELAATLKEQQHAVKVVKHKYETCNPVKYIGTPMQSPNVDYERKNWASLMLIDCEHPAWRTMTPEAVNTWKTLDLLQLKFLHDSEISELPQEWNRLADEGQSIEGAKILHWTAGIPAFEHYKHARGADLWRKECTQTVYPLLT
jgi:hypothetical protein